MHIEFNSNKEVHIELSSNWKKEVHIEFNSNKEVRMELYSNG